MPTGEQLFASFLPAARPNPKELIMKKECDFSKGKRGAILKGSGKTRITIYLDDEVISSFREIGDESGKGYQTLINEALREYLSKSEKPVDASTLRRILREELKKAG